MTDKIVAGLVTGVVAAPICAVCVLGPAAVGSVLAGAFGWLAGMGPIVTLALAIAVGLLTYRSICRKRRRDIGYATNEEQVAASKTDPPTRSVRTHSDRPRIRSRPVEDIDVDARKRSRKEYAHSRAPLTRARPLERCRG